MKTKAMARTGRTRKTTANSDAAARPPLAIAPAAAQFRPCKEGDPLARLLSLWHAGPAEVVGASKSLV